MRKKPRALLASAVLACTTVALLAPRSARSAPTVTSTAATRSLEAELTRHVRERYAGDLAEIKRHRVLRVLTRNNSSAYYVARGQERGFQFELVQAFAQELGVRLAIVVPPSRSGLIQALQSGEGDLIAAGMTITATRAKELRFSAPINSSPRVVVSATKLDQPLSKLEDLRGRPIHLSFRSTTYGTAKDLEARLGFPLDLVDVSDDVEMEEMMERVARGEYPLTIADEDLLDLERTSGLSLTARFKVSEPLPKAWAVRQDSPELLAAADAFVKKSVRNGLVKILYDRYYRPDASTSRARQRGEYRADAAGKISPWDTVFKREAAKVGLDWRLLAAVAFTESKFDPNVKSAWGAVGLMQVLPSTAKSVGVLDAERPESSIKAGAAYLKYLTEAFAEPSLEPRQRIRFALAAYNAGLGHIQDARILATRINKDPNVWFGNVEQALRLKRDPKWHEQTRFGYCRAEESIAYVSLVQSRYDVFARHVSAE
jgi:membrane-bound lytic murein transglycosylase F